MNPENKAFLEANRHYWITLRDAHFMMGLSGNTRSEMQRIMGEEFRPGYVTDLWCPTCVSDMVTALYYEFEKWEAGRIKTPVIDVVYEFGEGNKAATETIIITTEEEKKALEIKAKELQEIIKPIQTKANFPSHKNHRR